jgi:hypothetical protein
LGATDPDVGDTLTFTIQPGADASLFTIANNQLRVGNSGLDFESGATRSVTVRATDSRGELVDKTFSVQVSDSEEFTLTTGTDIPSTSASNIQVAGNAVTLNATENLKGGGWFRFSGSVRGRHMERDEV